VLRLGAHVDAPHPPWALVCAYSRREVLARGTSRRAPLELLHP
jgi:hypothetical protein